MIERIEQATTVEVGKFYDVPCVHASWRDFPPRWIVVHGSWHEDRQHFDFQDYHFHVDPRFVPHAIFRDFHLLQIFSFPVHVREPLACREDRNLHLDGSVVRKRRKCLREMPQLVRNGLYGFSHSLREAFRGQRLRGEVCPHKGYSLKGIKPDARGCRQCPLHGLLFDERGVCVG